MSEGRAGRPQMVALRDSDCPIGSPDWRALRPRLQECDDPRAAGHWRDERRLRLPRGSTGSRPVRVG